MSRDVERKPGSSIVTRHGASIEMSNLSGEVYLEAEQGNWDDDCARVFLSSAQARTLAADLIHFAEEIEKQGGNGDA